MTDYIQSSLVGTITYNIGTPALVSPDYAFTQDQACGYPEVVSVTGLPAFMTHNTGAATFLVP